MLVLNDQKGITSSYDGCFPKCFGMCLKVKAFLKSTVFRIWNFMKFANADSELDSEKNLDDILPRVISLGIFSEDSKEKK